VRVRRQREELHELLAGRDLLEQLPRLVVAVAELRDLFVREPGDVLARDLAVMEPLPTCEREISEVAVSSIRLKIATAPEP
jgi:hypothetical protein